MVELLGIISDVHNDLSSLEKAILKLRHCDRIIHVGDLIEDERGANKIIEMLIANNIYGVYGNHDVNALNINLNHHSWTLNETSRKYLNQLPQRLEFQGLTFIHDNPLSTPKTVGLAFNGGYIRSTDLASQVFKESKEQIMIVGHTHTPTQYLTNGKVTLDEKASKIKISPNLRYILNSGGITPKHNSTSQTVGVYDFKKQIFEVMDI